MTAVLNGSEAKCRPYDFRRPQKLTESSRLKLRKDQTGLADRLMKCLKETSGLSCVFELTRSIETVSLDLAVGGSSLVYRLQLKPENRPVLFGVEGGMVHAAVEQMLGGTGAIEEADRQPTEIEAILMSTVAKRIQDELARRWELPFPSDAPAIFVPPKDDDEEELVTGILSDFECTVGEAKSKIWMFYPFQEFAGVLGLDVRDRKSGDGEAEELGQERALSIPLEIQVRYPKVDLQVSEIGRLKKGDIVTMPQRWDEEIEIYVENRLMFLGFPGERKGNRAVKVTRPCE